MGELIFKKLLPFLSQWKTKKGYSAITLLIILSIPFLIKQNIPIHYLICCVLIVFILWSIIWFISSGRVILPQSKKTVVFCFDVDSEARKNYRRVLKRIDTLIHDLNLDGEIKFINIAQDIILDKNKAHRYSEKNKVNLIIWGNAFYGNLDSQKVLKFDLHHTMAITQSLREKLNLFLADVTLILQKKDWTIKEINELNEFKVLSDNLFETILFIIGIYFFDEKKFL